MTLREDIRRDARQDSRRFGKSVVCKIVYGPLLDFMYVKSLIPPGIHISNKTGLDPMSNKMIVIPTTKYPIVQKTFLSGKQQDQNSDDLDILENILKKNDFLIDLLKQNMILVTISQPKPKGIEAGPNPKEFDILIDSVDVNQAIEGTYVYSSVSNIREAKLWG